MDKFNEHLAAIFTQLQNTPLVQTKNATEANIAEFTKILNTIGESDAYGGVTIMDFIRWIYRRNPPAFYQFIHANNLPHLALLTHGGPLVHVLGIENTVLVHWDHNDGKFVVTAHSSRHDRALDTVNARPLRIEKTYRTENSVLRPISVSPIAIPPLSLAESLSIINEFNAQKTQNPLSEQFDNDKSWADECE